MSEITEDDLHALSNLYPDDTGLPMTVWVRPRSNERHSARIEVCTEHSPRMLPHDTVTMTLSPMRVIPPGGLSPADLRAVIAWIELNKATIGAHWEGSISSAEVVRRMQRLA
jgi:hypothetical protein